MTDCTQCFCRRQLATIEAILGRPDDQIPVAQIRAIVEQREPKPEPITLESGLRDVGISNRTATLLETRAGIYTLGTLLLWTPGLLLRLRDIGEASVEEIEQAIGRHGYRLSE